MLRNVFRYIAPLCVTFPLLAQAPADPPQLQIKTTPPTFFLSLRERTNTTQWFSATQPAELYGHQDSLLRFGIQQRLRHFDYKVEAGQPSELFLPSDAVSPVSAQGQLGLGGNYYGANGNNTFPAALALRVAYLRFHLPHDTDTLRAGRFEFTNGQEITPRDASLNWLQNNRIGQRLISKVSFSNGQRSFDGADATLAHGSWNITAMAGRDVQGNYNMNANPELNVDLQYLSYTRTVAREHAIVRGFALGYHDGRTGIAKTDNRSSALRALDHNNIRVGTYGADALTSIPAGPVAIDLLAWAAIQNGQWGTLSHQAGALVLEGGIRFISLPSKPWLRGGALRSTGTKAPLTTCTRRSSRSCPPRAATPASPSST